MKSNQQNNKRLSITQCGKKVEYQGRQYTLKDIIDEIYIHQSDDEELPFIEKYNLDYLISQLNKDAILQVENYQKKTKKMDLIEFSRIMLKIVSHPDHETIYLLTAVIELFREISESLNLSQYITFSDFTSYVSDKISGKQGNSYLINPLIMPPEKKFNNKFDEIRKIDSDAPQLYGVQSDKIYCLDKNILVTDSTHHENQQVRNAFYAEKIGQVIVLDQLSDKLNFYNLDCKLLQIQKVQHDKKEWGDEELNEKALKKQMYNQNYFQHSSLSQPKEQTRIEKMILNIAWSEKQQRLGACIKDFNLCFWDAADNFKFQKIMKVQKSTQLLQTNLWYLENLNQWVTVDEQFQINVWDIEEEELLFTLNQIEENSKEERKIQTTVFDIQELTTYKVVAIGSMDKIITIWNFSSKMYLFTINQFEGGIHCFRFFKQYQVLITIGFTQNAEIIKINHEYFDISKEGQLIGHQNSLTSLEIIEETPMVITGDDSGYIKVWDIRNLNCVQTFHFGTKTLITKLIGMYKVGKVAFVGNRLNVLDFEDRYSVLQKRQNPESFQIVAVQQNLQKNEIIVSTRKEVRFYNMFDGKMKYAFTGLLDSSDDEICVFNSYQFSSKFIIGDQKGQLKLFSYNNGEFLKQIYSHQNEVSNLKIDYTHNMLITSSYDSSIKMQQLIGNDSTLKREINNMYFGKEVTLIDVSVYHNILLTGNNSSQVCLFDYEFIKLQKIFILNNNQQPTAFNILNQVPILIIASNDGMIYFIKFVRKDTYYDCQVLSKIDIEHNNIPNFKDKFQGLFMGSTIKDLLQNQQQQQQKLSTHKKSNNNIESSPIQIKKSLLTVNNNNSQYNKQSSKKDQQLSKHKNSSHNISASLQQSEINELSENSDSDDDNTNSKLQDNKYRRISHFFDDQQFIDEFKSLGVQSFQQQASNTLNYTNNERKIKKSQAFSNIPSNILQSQMQKDEIVVKKEITNKVIESAQQIISMYWVDQKIQKQNFLLSSSLNKNEEEQPKKQKAIIIISTNTGYIRKYALDLMFQHYDLKEVKGAKERPNYNPYRNISENYEKEMNNIRSDPLQLNYDMPIAMPNSLKQILKNKKNNENMQDYDIQQDIQQLISLDETKSWQAHKDTITQLQFINFREKQILTSSLDNFIRIWSLQGDLICNLNISHPLPIKWDIKNDLVEQKKERILYGIKLLEHILERFWKIMSLDEEKMIRIDPFLEFIIMKVGLRNNRNNIQYRKQQNGHVLQSYEKDAVSQKIQVMKDEYEPRDIQYDKVYHLFQNEIKGLSLKRIQANQRIKNSMAQNDKDFIGQHTKTQELTQNSNLIENFADKNMEREQIAQYLNPEFHRKLINKQDQLDPDCNFSEINKLEKIFRDFDRKPKQYQIKTIQKTQNTNNQNQKQNEQQQDLNQQQQNTQIPTNQQEKDQKINQQQQQLEQINQTQNKQKTLQIQDEKQNLQKKQTDEEKQFEKQQFTIFRHQESPFLIINAFKTDNQFDYKKQQIQKNIEAEKNKLHLMYKGQNTYLSEHLQPTSPLLKELQMKLADLELREKNRKSNFYEGQLQQIETSTENFYKYAQNKDLVSPSNRDRSQLSNIQKSYGSSNLISPKNNQMPLIDKINQSKNHASQASSRQQSRLSQKDSLKEEFLSNFSNEISSFMQSSTSLSNNQNNQPKKQLKKVQTLSEIQKNSQKKLNGILSTLNQRVEKSKKNYTKGVFYDNNNNSNNKNTNNLQIIIDDNEEDIDQQFQQLRYKNQTQKNSNYNNNNINFQHSINSTRSSGFYQQQKTQQSLDPYQFQEQLRYSQLNKSKRTSKAPAIYQPEFQKSPDYQLELQQIGNTINIKQQQNQNVKQKSAKHLDFNRTSQNFNLRTEMSSNSNLPDFIDPRFMQTKSTLYQSRSKINSSESKQNNKFLKTNTSNNKQFNQTFSSKFGSPQYKNINFF